MKVMGAARRADSGFTADSGDVRHTPWNQRVRSLLLGPHGGGTMRRRASDAVRVGLATVLVVICVPLAQANSSLEIHITELIAPAPTGIHWLITALWFVGSIGVIVALGAHRAARATPGGSAADGGGRRGRRGRVPSPRCAARPDRGAVACPGLLRIQPALPHPPAGHRHRGGAGRAAVPEPAHAPHRDRCAVALRPVRGDRRLRAAARCHCRVDRRLGYGRRLPPRHGRAQRAPVGIGGERRRARPSGGGARAHLHATSGMGRGRIRRHGHPRAAGRARRLRARRRRRAVAAQGLALQHLPRLRVRRS